VKLKSNYNGVGRRLRLCRPFTDACARVLSPLLVMHLACLSAFAFDVRLEPTVTTSRPSELWLFLPVGYLVSVAVETPVLLVGLTKQLSFRQRLFAGLWLTACTYPIVVLVLPISYADAPRSLYLLVAETFAPVAECLLFWFAFRRQLDVRPQTWLRNFAVIVVANLLSFAVGELLNATRWFGLF
jgi:uncharacterized membrane-anchored protein